VIADTTKYVLLVAANNLLLNQSVVHVHEKIIL